MISKIIGDEGLPLGADPRLTSLLDYWRRKRAGRRFPSRVDLDPIDIPQLLPFLTLVDVAPAPDYFVYRLVGTAAAGIMRRDLTGSPVGQDAMGEDLAEVMTRYRSVTDDRVVLYHRVRTRENANDYSIVDRLMTPLGDDGEVSKVLSIIVRVGGRGEGFRGPGVLLR